MNNPEKVDLTSLKKVCGLHFTKEGVLKEKELPTVTAQCMGCGDYFIKEFAVGHTSTTLITETQSQLTRTGKFIPRCPVCEHERENRRGCYKEPLELKKTIVQADTILNNPQKYILNDDEIKLLKTDRDLCFKRLLETFKTPGEAELFLGQ